MTTIESGEICRKYKFGRTTLRYWRRQPGFPEPLDDRGNGGCTWDKAAIVEFFRTVDHRNKQRNARVRNTYRQCQNMAETARRHELDYKTVRRIVKT